MVSTEFTKLFKNKLLPGGDVRGSGDTCPNLIRQMNPRREPIHNRIDAMIEI